MSATETRTRALLPPVLGLFALAAFVAPALAPGVQLYYRDTGRLYYPVKLYIAQSLSQGRLPLWDPMTASGVSLLGQVTPGLLHPFTLLYAVLPFDLCFKLNHLLALVLAGIGTYRLARRLGTSNWAALAAAIAYGGCGYLISMTASNLPYSLGAGSVPIAVEAFLGFLERGGIARLAWAAAALALIAYAGEPQSMLLAGLIGGAWAILRGAGQGRARGAFRGALFAAVWAILGLCLAAPVALTARAQLQRSSRARGLSEEERTSFANHPVRLLGWLVPRAFDDVPEHAEGGSLPYGRGTYGEYFSDRGVAFSDSIVVGAPALLFALFAAGSGKLGRLLLAGAALLALASTGPALGIEGFLFALVPGAGYFRYAEKLIAPASLLVALAAALGADRALRGTRRAAIALFAASGALAAVLWVGALLASGPALPRLLVSWGKTHHPQIASVFAGQLRLGLGDAAALCVAVALSGLWRAARPGRDLVALGAACCAASAFASGAGLLFTAPVEYLRGPFELAEILKARGGPSPGRWRLFVNQGVPGTFKGMGAHLSAMAGLAQSLYPQFDSVAGIEGVAFYFSASDPEYNAAVARAPEVAFALLGVRFAVESPLAFTESTARARRFEKVGLGYWVREYAVGPRAFLVPRARAVATVEEVLEALERPGFDPHGEAVVRGAAGPLPEGPDSVALPPVRLMRPSAERMEMATSSPVPSLLVVGEHFDPGWRATLDGHPVPVLQTDGAALGVPVPAGAHRVELRFTPVGLGAGLWALAAAASVLGGAALLHYRRRAGGQILSAP